MEAAGPYILTQAPPTQPTPRTPPFQPTPRTPPFQPTHSNNPGFSTAELSSPKKSSKKVKYKSFNSNSSAQRTHDEPDTSNINYQTYSSSAARLQNGSYATSKYGSNSTGYQKYCASASRSHENQARRPQEIPQSETDNNLNKASPKIPQEFPAVAVPSVDSLIITVHNNANHSQRIVQNDAAHSVAVEDDAATKRTHQFGFPQSRPFAFDPPHLRSHKCNTSKSRAFPKMSHQSKTTQPSAPQPTMIQPSAPQPSAPQTSVQSSLPQVSAFPPILPQSSAPQPSAPQPGVLLFTALQPGIPQSSAPQSREIQPNTSQPKLPQSNAPQASVVQPSAPQPRMPQTDAPKPYGRAHVKNREQPQHANGAAHHQRPIGQESRDKQRRKNNESEKYFYRKVIVLGFPAYTKSEELVRKLAEFGTAEVEVMKNRVAVVLFGDEEEARAAVLANETIAVYGTILTIKKYTNRRHVLDLIGPNKSRMVRNEHIAPSVAAPSEIDLSGEFEQQVRNIEDAIRLTQEEVDNINLLFEDIEKYMRMIFPTCEAVPFGSITTGLGIKSSDADCFLSLAPGAGRPGAGAGALSSQFVSRAARLLRLYPAVFARLVPIPRANTPIIKFLHVPTNVNCDLNSKTPLGVQNSRLLGHLLRLDRRLGSLALLLKYWARVQRLSGTGRLTNYALLMLLVFYLQQSLLPPVCSLQGPAHSFIVENWEAGFDSSPLSCERELPPLRDLLGGFFQYYAEFDFDTLVVCPLIGRTLRKAEFESNVLPPQYALYRQNIEQGHALKIRTNSCLCIQDPFELSHNVASAVPVRLALDIKAHIKLAAAAYSQEEKSPGDFIRGMLVSRPGAALCAAPGAGAGAARVGLPARLLLRLPPDWQRVMRDTLLRVIYRDLMNVELARRDSVSREAGVDTEVYFGTVTQPVWRRGPAAAVCVPIEVEFGFRSKPRGLWIATTALDESDAADEESFRAFRQFTHNFIHRWHKQLLEPHLAAAGDGAPAARKSPKRSPRKKKEPSFGTRSGSGPVESVAFANANREDLTECIAAVSLVDGTEQNSPRSDPA